MNPNIAHIVFASDNRFSEILGVCLISLYENSTDMEDIIVYILDSGINETNRNRINSIAEKYHRSEIIWLPAQDISKVLSMDVSIDRGSISQYARLFVSSNLPEKLDRVIYLDCDIIINGSIRELWNLDIHDKTIAALKDAFSPYYRANIDLKKNDIMFNSGVMLINLKRWKEQKIEEKLLDFIKKRNGKIQQGDQGALNAVLSYDTYCFEPRLNTLTVFYDFNYQEMLIYRKPPKDYYNEEEIKRAIQEPYIIHFTTSFLSRRPWIIGCHHKYVDKWLRYKGMSPWSTAPLWEADTGRTKTVEMKLIDLLPRRLMVRLAGIAHAYIRPLKNRFM